MSSHQDRTPNLLVHETSPYLLQHAYNPVEWRPWGEEALAASAETDMPILLSIGYSACHWCHVMERECFENDSIAGQMNSDFICIKVDREERPDIDAIYMNAVQLMTGQGGWPMTVFLTPDGKPFYGGTYFPPEDRYGRPGFPRILEAVANAWKTQRDELENQGSELLAHMNSGGELLTKGPGEILSPAILETALAELSSMFDRSNGGFGSAPKFPQPANLDLLLRLHRRFKRIAPLEMVELTLQKMALGGIYDQLGGGFHRYSTDAVWLAPHFEKMLYDNAQLAQTYCRAYQITGKQLYRDIAVETLEYVLREMTDPGSGAFYSAQDADSEGEEGKYFVWTPEEVAELLGAERAAIFGAFYDISAAGNWEGNCILRVLKDASQLAMQFDMDAAEVGRIVDESRVILLAARERRIKPALDDKTLTSWNALMLTAFAQCGASFGRSDFVETAVRNAQFLISTMAYEKDGELRLLRTSRNGSAKLNGYLEDYAFLADGLFELYASTQDAHWLMVSKRLVQSMRRYFEDESDHSFFATSSDHEALVQRLKDWDDNAIPAGNSVALEVLLKQAALEDDTTLRDQVGSILRRLAPVIQKHPYGFARLLGVVDLYLEGPVEIALRGDLSDPALHEMLKVVHEKYLPNLIVVCGSADVSENYQLLLQNRPAIEGKATAYVCRNHSCSLPVTDVQSLKALLA
jgi:uncharacterized protein YyaL (SSP411 family)